MNLENKKTKWNLLLVSVCTTIILMTVALQSKAMNQTSQVNLKSNNKFELSNNIKLISKQVNSRSNQIYNAKFNMN